MSSQHFQNRDFQRFAWGVLSYTLLVVLGGAFVRATVSGDGCGNHWPDCHGQIVPEFAQAKTLIEFGHRASTGILLPLILALLVWAYRAFPAGHAARKGALASLALVLVEALIGAGLVRFQLVAQDRSVYRAVAMPAHLIATFGLLMALALTAWWGGGGRALRWRGQGSMVWACGMGLLAALLLGVSGAITALGDTLFPARSLAEGLRQDFSPSAHFLIGLRVYHPLLAVSTGLYLVLLAGIATHLRPCPETARFGRATVTLFLVQIAAGLLNLLLLAPVWMQILHLLLADLLWIALVLLCAAALAEGVPQLETGMRRPEGAAALAGAGPEGAPAAAAPRATWRDYLALTKPRVVSLLLLTTLAAMAIAAGGGEGRAPGVWDYLAVALGLYMAAGAANAINMVLERDLDERMGRTARRPTVTQAVPGRAALQFALVLAVGSFALLTWAANLLAAAMALAGLAFYIVVYTLLLKRRTWANIVIGGAAGAFPPLVGWAAVAGDLSPMAWTLFGIIFLWTPVHFWALALLIRDDYARAGVPMLPVVRGERATVVQIAFYTILTIAISALPLLLTGSDGRPAAGALYLGAAALLNAVLLLRSAQLYRRPAAPQARSLFKYSMVYLALLFLAMAVDRSV